MRVAVIGIIAHVACAVMDGEPMLQILLGTKKALDVIKFLQLLLFDTPVIQYGSHGAAGRLLGELSDSVN